MAGRFALFLQPHFAIRIYDEHRFQSLLHRLPWLRSALQNVRPRAAGGTNIEFPLRKKCGSKIGRHSSRQTALCVGLRSYRCLYRRSCVLAVHDKEQVRNIHKIVVGAMIGRVEGVSVVGKSRLHTDGFSTGDIALRPVADHKGVRRSGLKAFEHSEEWLSRGFSLARLIEGDRNIEDVMEPNMTEPEPRFAARRI